MPEGPEALLDAKDINSEVAGEVLFSVDFIIEKGKKYDTLPGKDKFIRKLPLNIKSVTARGKKVIWHLYDDDGRKFWIIFALGMTGIFKKKAGDHSDFRLNIFKKGMLKIDDVSSPFGPELKFSPIYVADKTIYFDDEMKWGNIYFCFTKDEKQKVFKDTGFDLMKYALIRNDDRQVARQYWKSINEKRRGNMKISKYVLEQKFFSGVGNYIKSEGLNRAKVHPGRLLSTITKEESNLILFSFLDILKESYEQGGAHLRDFYRYNGEETKFKCVIYQAEDIPAKDRGKKEGITDKYDSQNNRIKWIKYEDKRICYYTDIQV